jgi:hypothetical protein
MQISKLNMAKCPRCGMAFRILDIQGHSIGACDACRVSAADSDVTWEYESNLFLRWNLKSFICIIYHYTDGRFIYSPELPWQDFKVSARHLKGIFSPNSVIGAIGPGMTQVLR